MSFEQPVKRLPIDFLNKISFLSRVSFPLFQSLVISIQSDISRTENIYYVSSLTSVTISRYRFSHATHEIKPLNYTSLMIAMLQPAFYIIIRIVIFTLEQERNFLLFICLFHFLVCVSQCCLQYRNIDIKFEWNNPISPTIQFIFSDIWKFLWRQSEKFSSKLRSSHEGVAMRKNKQWRPIWNEQDAEYIRVVERRVEIFWNRILYIYLLVLRRRLRCLLVSDSITRTRQI